MNIEDCTHFTTNVIVSLFETHFLFHCKSGDKKSDFYCGITNDVAKRLSAHGVDDCFKCCQCASADIAADVENQLGLAGFETGNVQHGCNGKADDSVFVYMIDKRTKGFSV